MPATTADSPHLKEGEQGPGRGPLPRLTYYIRKLPAWEVRETSPERTRIQEFRRRGGLRQNEPLGAQGGGLRQTRPCLPSGRRGGCPPLPGPDHAAPIILFASHDNSGPRLWFSGAAQRGGVTSPGSLGRWQSLDRTPGVHDYRTGLGGFGVPHGTTSS